MHTDAKIRKTISEGSGKLEKGESVVELVALQV